MLAKVDPASETEASHFSVAEAKIAGFLKEYRKRGNNGNGEVEPGCHVGKVAFIYETRAGGRRANGLSDRLRQA